MNRCHTHQLTNSSCTSELYIRLCSPRYTVKDRREHEKYFFLLLRKMDNLLIKACAPKINESLWKVEWVITLCFQWFLTFYRAFKLKDSMRNTSAITAVIKFFMKPWCGATIIYHLCVVERTRENKCKLW